MKVFISSTIGDLEVYRAKAEEAVTRARCTPTMLKYWGPSGRLPLEECLRQVRESDLLVAMVAYRYGWVPADQPGKEVFWNRPPLTLAEQGFGSERGAERDAFC